VTTRSRRALVAGAALSWIAAAAGVGLSSAPAAAAGGRCTGGHGVTVVVDFGPLGGGTRIACDPDGGGESARTVMEHAGFDVDWVRTDPGFVCAIESRPDPDSSCGRVPPGDAYWALFWSEGSSKWTYSSYGAGGTEVSDGGSIGWRFQNGGARDDPGAAPTSTSSSTPTPTPTPTPSPTPHQPGGSGNGDAKGGDGDGDGNGNGSKGGDDGSADKTSPTPDDSASQSPSPKDDDERSDDVAVVGAPGGSGAGPSGGGDDDPNGKVRPDGKGDDAKAQRRDHSEGDDDPDHATQNPDATTVASAGVLEDQAAKPGPGDGVLTAVATTSVVLLGAAAGIVGWRRRS